MSHRTRHGPLRVMLVALLVTLVAVALSAMAPQAWAAPGQNRVRGTVPTPLPPRPPRVSLKGYITDLPDDSLVGLWSIVDKKGFEWQVEVGARTRIVPPFAQPSIGDRVRVIGNLSEDDPVTAKQVVIQRRSQGPGKRG